LLRGRGTSYIREASPLFDSPLASLSFSGKEQNPAFIILIKEHPVIRVFKRGVSPLFQSLPPLLIKERGTKGVRSLIIKLYRGQGNRLLTISEACI
jgi:hypothetical protein